MSGSNVASVVNYFPTVNEGFITTAGGIVSSGGSPVQLNSVSGLTNGSIFVGIIEPGVVGKEQVFTGTVNVGLTRIDNVVWTRGPNTTHAAGTTIVDYVTGTAINMMSAGFLKQHKQSGAHSNVVADSVTTTTLTVNGVDSSALTPTGILAPFAGSTAPTGWLLCDGSSVLRSTYANLFAVVGTTYGSVDGTHFTLPDTRGRLLAGYDVSQTEFNTLGKTGGQKTVQSHQHTGNTAGAGTHNHLSNTSGNTLFTAGSTNTTTDNRAGGFQQITWGNTSTSSDGNHAHSFTSDATGSGVNNLNPYLTVKHIIKV